MAGPARPGDPPWFNAVPISYRINLNASAVNGEIVQIERSDVNGLKLILAPTGQHIRSGDRITFSTSGPATCSCPLINSSTDGRTFAGTARRLRCTDRLRKIAV